MYVDYKHYDREPGAVARRVGASPPPTAAGNSRRSPPGATLTLPRPRARRAGRGAA